MLACGPDGSLAYANERAIDLLGPVPTGTDIGSLIRPWLASAQVVPLPAGGRAYYLAAQDVGHSELEFALMVSGSLAGNLNLRRTMARVMEMAVPGVGTWAAVTVLAADGYRRVFKQEGGQLHEELADGRSADRSLLARLHLAGTSPATLLDATDAAALGLDALFGLDGEIFDRAGSLLAPLRSQGSAIGLLAVGTDGSERSLHYVRVLAQRAAPAIAASRIYEERAQLASTLRRALLPAPLPEIPGIRLGAAYRPAQETTEVGGDFYEARPEPDGWALTVGDVCGKGVDAAVMTAHVRQSLQTASLVTISPVERVRLVNQALLAEGGNSYVTLVHAVLSPAGPDGPARANLVCAGHPPPFIRRSSGTVERASARGTLLGMLPEVRFEPVELSLAPGDTLVCFTDGLSEARGPGGILGEDALGECLADCDGMGAQAIADRLMQLATEHLGDRPHDDMAVVAVQTAEARTVQAAQGREEKKAP